MSEFSLILVLRKENKQNSNMTWQKYKLKVEREGLPSCNSKAEADRWCAGSLGRRIHIPLYPD